MRPQNIEEDDDYDDDEDEDADYQESDFEKYWTLQKLKDYSKF